MKTLKLNIYAAVLGFFLTVTAPVASARERIYFFGNSYIKGSGGMEKMVKALLEEGLNTTVDARSNTRNGARLTTQLQYLDGTLGSGARRALITGNNTNWDLVVLQDQSTIPAYTYSKLWYASLNAGVEINKLIEPTGAVTMFLLTWGRQRGLKNEPFFPNFRKMQEYLNFGYRQYQLAANDPPSFVAPVGIAYELIYKDTIAAGGSATSSPFKNLYAGDGSHPSQQGSYLAACVIYAAYTGRSVAELEWAPGNIGAGRRDYLQSKADEAVFDDDTFYPSRWDLPDFVGPGDELEPTAMPAPSVMPSVAPSISPSAVPSPFPTETASSAPSSIPSESPSESSLPSISSQPSAVPSAQPSTVPSLSLVPSFVPSSAPTASPSVSVSPSAAPSMEPSAAPSESMVPSDYPSAVPSISSFPSVTPTRSAVPSMKPSVSEKPSNYPSCIPTVQPSKAPSSAPSTSSGPSDRPSIVPSSIPTVQPSASRSPSDGPSVLPSLPPPSSGG
jgi:hypothetical protein